MVLTQEGVVDGVDPTQEDDGAQDGGPGPLARQGGVLLPFIV